MIIYVFYSKISEEKFRNEFKPIRREGNFVPVEKSKVLDLPLWAGDRRMIETLDDVKTVRNIRCKRDINLEITEMLEDEFPAKSEYDFLSIPITYVSSCFNVLRNSVRRDDWKRSNEPRSKQVGEFDLRGRIYKYNSSTIPIGL
jgi:hypothetical protein